MKAALLLLLTAQALALTPTPTQRLASAIGKAEGFGHVRARPTRLHNPGDLKSRGRYIHFANDREGWAALRAQIDRIIAGNSHFSVNLTLEQFGRRYAHSKVWAKNVARELDVNSDDELWYILDVAPELICQR
jgi:hypothetical protein